MGFSLPEDYVADPPEFLPRVRNAEARTWGFKVPSLWPSLPRLVSPDVVPGKRFREVYYGDICGVISVDGSQSPFLSRMVRARAGVRKRSTGFCYLGMYLISTAGMIMSAIPAVRARPASAPEATSGAIAQPVWYYVFGGATIIGVLISIIMLFKPRR